MKKLALNIVKGWSIMFLSIFATYAVIITICILTFGATGMDSGLYMLMMSPMLFYFALALIMMIVSVIIFISKVKKQEKLYNRILDDEVSNLQKVEGSKSVYLSENWLVIKAFAQSNAMCKDEVVSVKKIDGQLSFGYGRSSINITLVNNKHLSIVNNRDNEKVYVALKKWLNPEFQEEVIEQNEQGDRYMSMNKNNQDTKGIIMVSAVAVVVVAILIGTFYLLRGKDSTKTTTTGGTQDVTYLDVVDNLKEYATDKELTEKLISYISEADGDDDLIEAYVFPLEEGSNTYQMNIYNGSEYYWTGDITLYDEDDKELDVYYPFMVAPESLINYKEFECDKYPDTYTLTNNIFIEVTYEKPTFDYIFDYGHNADDVYYMAFIMDNADLTYENVVSMSKRQLFMNLLGEYYSSYVYFIDNVNEPVDKGDYEEYDINNATYAAYLDVDNRNVVTYEVSDGQLTEIETIEFLNEEGEIQ